MDNPLQVGPSSTADWEEHSVCMEATRPLTVYAIPDAASDTQTASNQPVTLYYLPRVPLLVQKDSGDPIFALTLLLSRQPHPDEINIQALIQQGHLSMDVTLALPSELLEELERAKDIAYRPLFASETIFELVGIQDSDETSEEKVISLVSTSGPNARVTLNANLNREECLDVLAALDSTASRIKLRTKVVFRTAAEEQTACLAGSWAAVYDFVGARAAPGAAIALSTLFQYFNEMLTQDIVSAKVVASSGVEEEMRETDIVLFFDMFLRLSSVILQREIIAPGSEQAENLYVLRERPNELFRLDIKQKISSTSSRAIVLSGTIDEVIGGALAGREWDCFVQLVLLQSGEGGARPVSRRVQWVRQSDHWTTSRDTNATYCRTYEERSEPADPAYRLSRCLSQPNQFLIVPRRYCISRYPKGDRKEYCPATVVYAALDPSTPANNRVNLKLTLQPDLPSYLRRELMRVTYTIIYIESLPLELRYLTEIATNAVRNTWALDSSVRTPLQFLYPTEIATNAVQATWLVDSHVHVEIQAEGPLIHVIMETDVPGWLLLKAQLENTGVLGSIQFTLPDGSSVQSSLDLSLRNIKGPWQAGPVEVERLNDEYRKYRMTNRIEQTVHIDSVWFLDKEFSPGVRNWLEEVVQVTLEPGQTVDRSSGLVESYLERVKEFDYIYSVATDDPELIPEVRTFVEDIYATVQFLNLVNFANHNLVHLEIRAQMIGVEGIYSAQLTQSTPTAEIEIVLPLTTYLEKHTLQYQVIKEFTSGERSTTPWFDMYLNQDSIVSLTWEAIQ